MNMRRMATFVVMRRLWRGRIRRVGAYIDRHAWTHWALALAFWAAFFALAEFGYSAAHDGRTRPTLFSIGQDARRLRCGNEYGHDHRNRHRLVSDMELLPNQGGD